jgi:hypothetical protein
MEKDACRCKKSKYYHNRCGCKSKRCKKKDSDTSSTDSDNSSHRNHSIKIKVDCNRGVNEYAKPKECMKIQETDYKDELLKYLLTNTNNKLAIPHTPTHNNLNIHQNNIKFISGIISPCFDTMYSLQSGYGYTAEYMHTSISDQWIIKIDNNHIINFILIPIQNTFSINAFIDSSSLETSLNFKPRFLNRIVINVKEPLSGFSFFAICN